MVALQAALREKDAEILRLGEELEAAAHKQDDAVAQVSQSVSQSLGADPEPAARRCCTLVKPRPRSPLFPPTGYIGREDTFRKCRGVSFLFVESSVRCCNQDDARPRKGKQ